MVRDVRFRREPLSAAEMLEMLLYDLLCDSERGQRLLLHWWRRGIEQQAYTRGVEHTERLQAAERWLSDG